MLIPQTRRTLRVFISHSCSNQTWQTTDSPPNFETGEGVPSWTLRIQGRLLDPADAPKFSELLKAMRVEIERDPTLYPEPNHIEVRVISIGSCSDLLQWHNTTQEQPVNGQSSLTLASCSHFAGFNITRRGDQPSTRIRIMLHPAPTDPSLVRFKLSQPLSALLDMTSATRPDAIAALWSYIRTRGLFDKVDRRKVRADDVLRTVANADMFDFHHVPDIVTRHLVHPEPIVLTYHLECVPFSFLMRADAW